MNLYIENHTFHYEMESLTRVFFPNEKIKTIRNTEGYESPCIITKLDEAITVSVTINGFSKTRQINSFAADEENELEMAILLYELLQQYTGVTQPWGIQTGVRPVKLLRNLMGLYGREGAVNYYREKLLVSEKKTQLALQTEAVETEILDLSVKQSFSLYISVPFCPSRCSYCSFVSQSIGRAKHLMQPYTDLLCSELEYTAQIAKRLHLKLETVYIGGGTPTTLEASQLEQIISCVNQHFDMESCREFTVEAGRPDTITEEKLAVLKQNGVQRISINPQTLNDAVLERIGRKHTGAQTLQAFALARKAGFDNINADLIVGLPEEPLESFQNTLQTICGLNPESITIHTLCIKRSADLTEQNAQIQQEHAKLAGNMLDYAGTVLMQRQYHPYYLYRQSRMVGNFENVGWSKPGYEGLYNIYVMDETHTVLACGAGAVTKLKQYNTTYLERIFNFKYPYEYINRFDELLDRKNNIIEFYGKYN